MICYGWNTEELTDTVHSDGASHDVFDIVQLAGGLCQPSIRRVFVFACYLDDSGKDQRVLTLAGYVAHINAWRDFEIASEELLARYEVPIFHGKDFHDTKGTFAGWSRVKKQSFTREWYDIAKPKLEMGISISMRQQKYRSRQKELGLNQSMSVYGCCFSTIVATLIRNSRTAPYIEREGISFLVESGNSNNGEIEGWFHKFSEFPEFKGALKSISFVNKASSRAIQLADFYAFYSRRDAVMHDRFDGKLALPINAILGLMEDRVHHLENVVTDPYPDDGLPAGALADFVFPEQSS